VNAPLVQVRGLSKRFPGTQALSSVDFAVSPGEIVGLVGKNGSGKSTLIKILAGLEHADGGSLEVDGLTMHRWSGQQAQEAGLHFVFQELEEFADLTVAENVLLGSRVPKLAGIIVSQRVLQREAARHLEAINCPAKPGARMDELSAVERRQVMVARALAGRMRLLVLDEPTASLSPREVDDILRLCRALRTAGVAVIYVSHRLQEVLDLADRVVVLRDGHLVFEADVPRVTLPGLVEAISGHTRALQGQQASAGHRTPAPGSALLTVRGLSDGRRFFDVSFELHAGEVVGIGGLIGSGRTELLTTIAGGRAAAAGTITYAGRPVEFHDVASALAAGIVLLPEERRTQGVINDYGVRQNATLSALGKFRAPGPLSLVSGRKERAAVGPLVEKMRMKIRNLEQPVSTLSGGTQQKVIMARALLSQSTVIMMDEPTAGIDVEAKEEIYDLVDQLTEEGKGLIVVSSDFAELERMSDRIVVLSRGQQVGVLAGSMVREDQVTRMCYLQELPSGA
jgi:ABC-type sugar transport system ATPase subunit